jgi:hypothetical protein
MQTWRMSLPSLIPSSNHCQLQQLSYLMMESGTAETFSMFASMQDECSYNLNAPGLNNVTSSTPHKERNQTITNCKEMMSESHDEKSASALFDFSNESDQKEKAAPLDSQPTQSNRKQVHEKRTQLLVNSFKDNHSKRKETICDQPTILKGNYKSVSRNYLFSTSQLVCFYKWKFV